MNKRFSEFLKVLKALGDEGVEYVLVGGYAVILHGASRNTEDIDVFVKATEDNLAQLRKALNTIFDDESISEITSNELKEYPVIRYVAPDDFAMDIISNLGERFSFDDIKFTIVYVQDVPVRLANVETLYTMKEKTYRAIDQADLLFLAEKINRQKQ